MIYYMEGKRKRGCKDEQNLKILEAIENILNWKSLYLREKYKKFLLQYTYENYM